MSLRSQERAAKRKQKRELARRRRAYEHEHFKLAARLGIAARRLKQKAQTIHKRRVGDFHVGMLDGHPANIADQVKRFIALAYRFGAEKGYLVTVTATTDGTHATGSYHYIIVSRNEKGWAVDLIFATVGQMEEFQEWADDRSEHGDLDWFEFFGPADFYVKDGTRIVGHFPDHGDHLHGAPKPSYRR
jgi:hypothetical protein